MAIEAATATSRQRGRLVAFARRRAFLKRIGFAAFLSPVIVVVVAVVVVVVAARGGGPGDEGLVSWTAAPRLMILAQDERTPSKGERRGVGEHVTVRQANTHHAFVRETGGRDDLERLLYSTLLVRRQLTRRPWGRHLISGSQKGNEGVKPSNAVDPTAPGRASQHGRRSVRRCDR